MLKLLLISIMSLTLHINASHVTTSFGNPKYQKGFTHFDYHNPNAIKGGEITQGWLGHFNSFNPWIIQGEPFPMMALLCTATLLSQSYDEIASSYAYVAESVDVANDLTSVTFKLRDDATFDNGKTITADDIEYSFCALRDKGKPQYKSYFLSVDRVEIIDPQTIKFHCPINKSREIGLILGQIPVLSKEFFQSHDFGASLETPGPSSGAYTIKSFEMGRRITFERRKNWWGESIPSKKGSFNVDTIHVDFFP